MVTMYVRLGEEGTIDVITDDKDSALQDMIPYEFPDDFDIMDSCNYSIVDGSLIRDRRADKINAELKKQEQKVAQADTVMRMAVQPMLMSMDDESVASVSSYLPEWKAGESLQKDDVRTYDGRIFRVVQAHTSQETWIPGTEGTASLYSEIVLGESGYILWKQPTGAHDSPNKGSIREYDGEVWISKIDGNTTVPGSDDRWWAKYEG